MTKFDPDNIATMLQIIAAEASHPLGSADGPTQRFSMWSRDEVEADGRSALAIGYTRSYGLLSFTDSAEQRLEWVPADKIKRVTG